MIEKYPQPEDWAKFRNDDLTNMMTIILDVVSGIRGLKKHYELAKESDPMVVIHCKSDVYGNEQLAEFEEAVRGAISQTCIFALQVKTYFQMGCKLPMCHFVYLQSAETSPL